jgi:hypothetical protein
MSLNGRWHLVSALQVQRRNHFSIQDVASIAILRLPPHTRVVYLRRDLKKTELIAKQVREGSNERNILKYLHSLR